MKVLLERLLDLSGIDMDMKFIWEDLKPITIQDVQAAIEQGIIPESEPYGDTGRYPATKARGRNYHLARILYFVANPDEIAAVEVDNECNNLHILPACVITDGWHRIAAAMILQVKEIEIDYGGREDIALYLTGRTDLKPDEVI